MRILGKANKDGSIELASNLSPNKKAEVIAHEEQHQKDMSSGKLDYNNNSVIWNEETFKRTPDKKIVYNGKKYIEGHPKLPWEIAANKVERKVTT